MNRLHENSIFGANQQPPTAPVIAATPVADEAVLQALLADSVGRTIATDPSPGKVDSLSKLAPQSRGLKRLLHLIQTEGVTSEGHVTFTGADDAAEVLETLYDITANKYIVPSTMM